MTAVETGLHVIFESLFTVLNRVVGIGTLFSLISKSLKDLYQAKRILVFTHVQSIVIISSFCFGSTILSFAVTIWNQFHTPKICCIENSTWTIVDN